MNILGIILSLLSHPFFLLCGVVGISLLIAFHEFGHFIFCKLFGVHTPSFSIGMGPRLLQKKIGDTNFVISAIPMGGYVEIAGSAEIGQGDQKHARSKDNDSLASKPYYQKMLIVGGGILFNIIFGYIILSGLYFTGIPHSMFIEPPFVSTTIETVTTDSPAAQAGLHELDKIIRVNNIDVTDNPRLLTEQFKDKAQKQISLIIERNNKKEAINVTLGQRPAQQGIQPESTNDGFLGVVFAIPPYSLPEAIKAGIQSTNTLFYRMIVTFHKIFSKKGINSLGGPILIISHTMKEAQKGIKVLLMFLVFISINLAVLNLLPLPIMDGGQALFYTIEAVMGRPISPKIKEYIHYACWLGLLALLIYLSIKDSYRIFCTN